MTEEQVTKAILDWLETNGWEIICFDFPQSGTGIYLHPNENIRTTKNKGAIVVDIVAIKKKVVVFFENKDRFVLDDFIKVQELKEGNDYSESISKLLKDFSYTKIFYGVGLPETSGTEKKIKENIDKIDFAAVVSGDRKVKVNYEIESIFV